ncbi:efflux RND transporter permease subunit [Paraliomyxa miuraensis]|uniref:efflux RND transporter permease subunit n=1 Tax=Paraliomyxa miuraensis TaxID=376150 RepID=UPI002257231F|nr:efflux RND transporter permease subunit [Paraliomyxa miuraensis]MCX4244239.1 efflux RND transporter permease subunit [Paraliomyxa miuraensis]
MIEYLARHRTAANLLMLMIIVLGVTALPGMRRETFPDFASTTVTIRVIYPGASATEVEESVVQPIEDSVDGVVGVEEVVSTAQEGLAVVTVEMQADRDIVTFQADVEAAVGAIDEFPDDAEEPVITRQGDTQPVVSIAVTGPMPDADLEAYCRVLERELSRLPEVSLVEVTGFSEREIQVRLDDVAIRQYDLTVEDVVGAIGRQSVDAPVGSILDEDGEVLLRIADQRRTPSEYEDLVLMGDPRGGEVRLGDVASIELGFARDEQKILFDGKRAGLLKISKTSVEDSLRILAELEGFIAAKEHTKPPGVTMALTQDATSIVEDRLELLVVNGYQGLVLVFVTLWLFLNWRLALWVAAGLPVSFLGAFFVMGLVGYSLNMITMLGLLLALGLLMDDGIVLAENVAAHLQRGESALAASVEGVREVVPGVLSSFATTICVFLPMAFLEGSIGRVLLVLPVVLIVVLAVSLVEAFLILPNHLAHSLHGHEQDPPGRFRRAFDAAFDRVREQGLGRTIDLAMRWRYVTLGLVVTAFLVAIGMLGGGVLKFQGFPDIEGDTAQARILLPAGTSLQRTEEVVAGMTAALERTGAGLDSRQPEGQRLIQHVSTLYDTNADAAESGPHVATISVDLLSAEIRDAPIDEFFATWSHEAGILSDTISVTYAEPGLGPAGRPIEIRVQGDDLSRLQEAARRIEAFFGEYAGVSELGDDLRPGKPEVRIRLRPGATTAMVDTSALVRQLRAAFQGQTAREVQVDGQSTAVDVALSRPDSSDLGDLEYFLVEAGSERIPLGSIASFEHGRGWSKVTHVDGLRTVTVTGDVDTRVANVGELITVFGAELLPALREEFPDVTIAVMGESAESATTMQSMMSGMALGLFGVFVLLSFQFRSYAEPLIVMVAIPLALIGVIFGHLLMGTVLTMPSLLGFVSLAGIVVNDSILLVEFVKAGIRSGQDVSEAARQASRLRFRAILLTSATTVAGLLPLLAERSLQAQVLIPMAISIVFGILASTVLVLVVVPSLYAILADFGLTARLAED